MIGHGSPISFVIDCARILALAIGALVGAAGAGEVELRLRFEWACGEGPAAKWHGVILIEGAALSELQPLGIEPDAAAAVRIEGDRIIVAPLLARRSDGCDVTVRADESAGVRIDLRDSLAPTPAQVVQVVEAPLAELRHGEVRKPLGEAGGFVHVRRAPGDHLRVAIDREHMVFGPNESFALEVTPDLPTPAEAVAAGIEARLVRIGSDETLWETSLDLASVAGGTVQVGLQTPRDEGAYRLILTARRRSSSLAGRLMRLDRREPLAERHVDFLVIDPTRRSPQLSDEWEVVETIEPASAKWRQRLPHWAALEKLPKIAPARAAGNVAPAPVEASRQGLVQLQAIVDGEPAWQSYELPVSEPGEPHAVELELPEGRPQRVAACIVERDASGRMKALGNCAVIDCSGEGQATKQGEFAVKSHRLTFWPGTRSPMLLLVNRTPGEPVHYGKIRLVRRVTAPARDDAATAAARGRLIAAYIAAPDFAEQLGGVEEINADGSQSLPTWQTFLDGSTRLAQHLRAAGYNGAVVGIAAQGSSLAPLPSLGASSRFDGGVLSEYANDPLQKDVLEALLRVFDREGLRLIPAIELAAPLPKLEALQAGGDPQRTGIGLVDAQGRAGSEQLLARDGAAPHYNILKRDVQEELGAAIDELTARYGEHPSLAGVSLQLRGDGYGVLPGLAWGFDEPTVREFGAAIGVDFNLEGGGLQQRAQFILREYAPQWRAWRQERVAQFYGELARRVAARRGDLRLVLCTEDLFAGSEAAAKLQQVAGERGSLGELLADMGFDPRRIGALPGVSLLRPRRLGHATEFAASATDLRINSAAELDQAAAAQPRGGELHVHCVESLRLASFDARHGVNADGGGLDLPCASPGSSAASHRALASALAARDFALLVEGGRGWDGIDDERGRETRLLLQSLPAAGCDVRTEQRQPIVMRTYRDAAATTVCLINESAWPVKAAVPLECEVNAAWRERGDALVRRREGVLSAGGDRWVIELPPYGVASRHFESPSVAVGKFEPELPVAARAALEQRMAEIEQRLRYLDAPFNYPELQNPGFEASGPGGHAAGWKARVGDSGSVTFERNGTPGGAVVHLHSEDALGVAVQSQQFAMPATGQLAIAVQARTRDLADDAQLVAWVEYEVDGVTRQRRAPLVGQRKAEGEWSELQFALDDLPLGGTKEMRIHLHLTGRGDAWIDNVRLSELWYSKERRGELFKWLYAANTALDAGQLMDCQRMVDSYWARHLLEYASPGELPLAAPTSVASRATDSEESAGDEQGEDRALGRRLRGMAPRILR